MKKILFVFLSLLLLTNLFNVNAAEPVVEVNDDTEVVYYDDGSYLVVETTEEIETSVQPRTPFYKRAEKVATKYNNDDEIQWKYTLEGNFLIEIGQSVECTNALYNVVIYNDVWKFSDGEAYPQNNVAYGLGKFKHKVLGITVQTVELNLSLVCDIYSNIS